MAIAAGQTIRAQDFVGWVIMWAASSLPTGWLECDGSAVSRATYAALFTAIGTTWGAGDGSTTFNLPDLRSSVPVGIGQKTRAISFDGASAVNPGTDEITVASNDWLHTGQKVALTGSSLPTGLSATDYYVIRVSATVIKLATSMQAANHGDAVDITVDGSGACTLTQVLPSYALAAAGGVQIQGGVAKHFHDIPEELIIDGEDGLPSSSSGADTQANNDTGTEGQEEVQNMPPYVGMKFIIKT